MYDMYDMTHSHRWHDSSTCVTRCICMCDMPHAYVWHVSFQCVTWLIHICDTTHSHVWHESFTCETWLIQMPGMPHSFCVTTHSCETWLIQMTCETWLIQMPGMLFCVTTQWVVTQNRSPGASISRQFARQQIHECVSLWPCYFVWQLNELSHKIEHIRIFCNHP